MYYISEHICCILECIYYKLAHTYYLLELSTIYLSNLTNKLHIFCLIFKIHKTTVKACSQFARDVLAHGKFNSTGSQKFHLAMVATEQATVCTDDEKFENIIYLFPIADLLSSVIDCIAMAIITRTFSLTLGFCFQNICN